MGEEKTFREIVLGTWGTRLDNSGYKACWLFCEWRTIFGDAPLFPIICSNLSALLTRGKLAMAEPLFRAYHYLLSNKTNPTPNALDKFDDDGFVTRFVSSLFRFTPVILIGSLLGCANVHYVQVKEGKLSGKLLVEWIDADLFVFTPDKEKPLTFVRFNEERIQPGAMLTDGGSIPRPFWILRSYSPWGYAPAFIVHDWLFAVKHCGYQGFKNYTFDETAMILSEVVKTMMLDPKHRFEDKLSMYAIYEAVKSPIAREIWENGKCNPPPGTEGRPPLAVGQARISYVIEFP
jgi:hypothetical protein